MVREIHSSSYHQSCEWMPKNQAYYKWKLIGLLHLIYASLCFSVNTVLMETPSKSSMWAKSEKYINLLALIKPVQNNLYFTQANISKLDCDQSEDFNIQNSSSFKAVQMNFNSQYNSSLYDTPLLPISFIIEMIPYPKLNSGRSFIFSRLDNYNRIRIAIGLNQWGKIGECMELWIHHELFYSIEPTPRISTYYTGSGLVNHAGLVVVPLPSYRFKNNTKVITLIIEVS
ncbi:unnamed protein product [Heterobilharzia americana]|nr:unnamed protein product [Heterobilharzia americana]